MKTRTIAAALLAAALLPALALASESPAPADKANAARACKALKASMGDTFAATYGTNADKSKAMGVCVSRWARQAAEARKAAQAACAAVEPKLRGEALRRCVAERQQAATAAAQTATVKAARSCRAERTRLGDAAFAAKHGGKANAFGKCVAAAAQPKRG